MSGYRPTVREIQHRVARHYGVAEVEMTSNRTGRAQVRPRQIAMYLTRHCTHHSLPKIGLLFGGRDHTTVIHACRKVEELMKRDGTLAVEIEALSGELTRGPASLAKRAREVCRTRRADIEAEIEGLKGALRALEKAEAALDSLSHVRWPSEARVAELLAEISADE